MKRNAHHEILITIAAASVAVSLSGVSLAANATSNGPATADIDSSVTYAISVYGSPGNIGGLNVASDHGTL